MLNVTIIESRSIEDVASTRSFESAELLESMVYVLGLVEDGVAHALFVARYDRPTFEKWMRR